jgi:hypothetical protein
MHMKTVAVNTVSDAEAYAIVRRDLQKVVNKTIRAAHKAGSRGDQATAEHNFSGPLLDASIQLGDEFETLARACVPGEAWTVGFGYTVIHHAPGTMIIRLK